MKFKDEEDYAIEEAKRNLEDQWRRENPRKALAMDDDDSFMDEMLDYIKKYLDDELAELRDTAEYQDNPMKYYGLSNRDFL